MTAPTGSRCHRQLNIAGKLIGTEPADTETTASQNEQLLRLAAALARIPDAQREAVVLHHLQEWPLAEVAEQLGRSESAVAGLLHRGLKSLRRMLEDSK